ncbi:hypothetical protein [Methyloceanibacter sp.]|uniref:hypothetical protein n=1 Tax=Methyloceanibacter sp. TaxID=1965321 RepID=UPI002087E4D5|nr:hypothetical protein [Methyloceanibacter sp.]GFO82850.1 MAG: hypothetical protein A49_24770 [Methyloceanibacter sp.]HML90992.1 hypothetical protein [Methyloceanibacter sp.]
MRHWNEKVWIVGLAAFGLIGSPALALSPHAIDPGSSWVVPVMDQEDLSVEEDLVPDEVPDGMKKSEDRMEPAPEPKGEDAGDIEDETLKHDLETGD